ncbi:MAG: hypothetical protein A2937_03410 [Candidatus Yonathbacteria bacterium RIFCSPLOWO2_01_FULL_47_33b]|uniref:Uncharacterized protein n=1 Tax=Candidatus Yonathbacteria bacterium RIFCSPLOWO2_01_FULL_47_33b TaxID=1802727 RepID=A0A1G2SIP4_9BACT|nr:MAG: hypothetical protein A2937_03410 [Candidatus Yonathbacteria bacterium RIFCSPLOWO2_01_FULL_47_33b]
MSIPKFVRPEFFDIFGIATFGVITFVGARGLFWGEQVPFWALIFLFVVGIAGLIIDGAIVYRTYLRKDEKSGTDTPNMVN